MSAALGRVAFQRVAFSSKSRLGIQIQRVACSNPVSRSSLLSLSQAILSSRSYATKTVITTDKKVSRPEKSASTTAAKKTVKNTVKKKVVKKPVKKVVKKKKVVAKKPAKEKQAPSEKTLVRLAAKKLAADRRELVATSLMTEQPKLRLRDTIWTLYISDRRVDKISGVDEMQRFMKDLAVDFKKLGAEERQALRQRVEDTKAKETVKFKEWIQSYTPDQIRLANNARYRLKRAFFANKPSEKGQFKRGPARFDKLDDPRRPVRPTPAYLLYYNGRYPSMDTALSFVERGKIVGQGWKTLSEAEKKVYQDRAAEDANRFRQEYLTVFGNKSKASPAA